MGKLKTPRMRLSHPPDADEVASWLDLALAPLRQAACVALFQKWEEKTFLHAARAVYRKLKQVAPE